MKLSDLTHELNALLADGYGDLPVYAINGETGEAIPLSSPCIDEVSDDQPKVGELAVGEKYVSIFGGE